MSFLSRLCRGCLHAHNHQVVERAVYVHVNKFTGETEKFPALLLRCACGHKKAEALVTSYTVTMTIPIDVKKWKRVTEGAEAVAPQPVSAPGAKPAPSSPPSATPQAYVTP